MKEFLRSLFGLTGASSKRQVVGVPQQVSVKDLPYIKESNRRLAALKNLCGRFQHTAYARQVEQVLAKTKRIHTYLVTRNRSQELELFHLQHTDHFLNTFTVILNVHQQQHELFTTPTAGRKVVLANPFKSSSKQAKEARLLNQKTGEQVLADSQGSRQGIPKLLIPEIAINTYSRVVYLQDDRAAGQKTYEIGYTSSQKEKDAFVAYVTEKFAVQGITYSGNTLVYLTDHNSNPVAGLAPVVHWHGCPYVVSLAEGRLYPVRTIRKQSGT